MFNKARKKITFPVISALLLLVSGTYIFVRYQNSLRPKAMTLSGIILPGSSLVPPRDYCQNGQYLVSKDGRPLFSVPGGEKTVIQLRNESGEAPIKNTNKYFKEEVFIEAVYEPDKAMCLALMCSCEDFITVKSIKLKTERTLGYIKEVVLKDGRQYLLFEPAEWLTSLDGTCVYEENKNNFPDLPECNYNGFLIVKSNTEKELALSDLPTDGVEVVMQTLNHDSRGNYVWDEKISLEKLEQIIENPQTAHEKVYRDLPFWLEIENNEIKKITEQYLP